MEITVVSGPIRADFYIYIYIYFFLVCLCFYRLNITFRTQIWTLNTLCTLHVVNFFFGFISPLELIYGLKTHCAHSMFSLSTIKKNKKKSDFFFWKSNFLKVQYFFLVQPTVKTKSVLKTSWSEFQDRRCKCSIF